MRLYVDELLTSGWIGEKVFKEVIFAGHKLIC